MAYWNWNTFNGISDDSTLGRAGEFLDCEAIDLHDTPGYVIGKLNRGSLISIGANITLCKDSTTYPMFISTNNAYLGFGGVTCLDSGGGAIYAKSVEQIGTSTLPVTYWFQNSKITQQAYNGASFTFNQNITTNVPTGDKLATCVGAGRIYFSCANKIHVINTTVAPTTTLSTVNATAANDKIPYGYTIKYMYIYMDVMNVVTTDGRDTIIYQLKESSTTDVWDIIYYHRVRGAIAISAVGDGNNIYWITKNSAYVSNGVESQKVKTSATGSSIFDSGFCTFYDGILKIGVPSSSYVYEYGHKKPGYSDILIKDSVGLVVTAMDGDILALNSGSSNYVARISTSFNYYGSQYTITSLPYSAHDFLSKKEGTYMRVGHFLPAYSTYSNTSILCSVTVKVITDEMEQKGLSSGITVATITTPTTGVSERYTDIDTQEIINAISAAGHNPDFHYIKIQIVGANGDPTNATGAGTVYRKSPRFYGVRLLHNEIKKGA